MPSELFASCPPGLEPILLDEVREEGFAKAVAVPGGVTFQGDWPEVWRANIRLRGAGRILMRFAQFRVMHLAQLDKRARKVAWSEVLRPDVPVRVEAICRKSRIYHAKAAVQRIETAISETLGAPLSAEAEVVIKARIEDDLCTLSVDTSGEGLHKRGFKTAVSKAPLRETLAAQYLAACGYTGAEPVVDPMCGSGTIVIEAAERALALAPGRARRFAFEHLAGFDADAVAALRRPLTGTSPLRFYGSDRDQGAIGFARGNAERAGVQDVASFACHAVSDLQPPEGPKGLVLVNPPYGARIGNRKLLFGLYGALGEALRTRFAGWRVGLITSDGGLAKATGLPLQAGPPVPHGGLSVKLYQSKGALRTV